MVSAQPTFVDTLPSNRNAVIEQFTHRNIWIPETDSVINRIISENSTRVFGITMHDLELPSYSVFKDFTCEDGLEFIGYFNPWNYYVYFDYYPVGMVNRGNIEGMETWKNGVNTILSQPSCLNVAAKGNIDWDLRQLTLTVEVYYTDNSNVSENYLTVALLQNNLEDNEAGARFSSEQGLPNANYNHLRVLRDIISPAWGDTITTTTQGSCFTKTYTYTIPDTIESKLPVVYRNRSIRPEVFLEDLEIIIFIAESKTNIISGNKAEIIHNNVPKINLRTQLDNIDGLDCINDNLFPLYLTLKNGGSDTIYSIEYDLLQDNQTILQNQIWDNRPIYPFTMDTITIYDIHIDGGVESLISIEIAQLNENDTIITVENTFTRYLLEDARGAMTLVIAHDQYASHIYFYIANLDDNSEDWMVVSNFSNPWSDLNSPGIREYYYDFIPQKTGCHYLVITDNLNKGYGEGYFKLLAEDGTVLLYNDGKNCGEITHFINVTELYNGIQDFQKKTISIFPNPAQTHFTVTNTANATLHLYSMVGQEMLRTYGTDENTVINVNTLPQGVYVLKVTKDGVLSTHKVVVR